MNDLPKLNGIIVTPTINERGKPVMIAEMFLNGVVQTWVEYDLAQFDNLISVFQKRRKELAKLKPQKAA